MTGGDFASPARSAVWDVWLSAIADPFLATGESLTVVTVAAPTVSEALAHRNTLRALKKGLAVLDVVASGTSSAAVAAIQSRARQAADDAAREAWHKNGPDPAVARIVGSRLLGSSG